MTGTWRAGRQEGLGARVWPAPKKGAREGAEAAGGDGRALHLEGVWHAGRRLLGGFAKRQAPPPDAPPDAPPAWPDAGSGAPPSEHAPRRSRPSPMPVRAPTPRYATKDARGRTLAPAERRRDEAG